MELRHLRTFLAVVEHGGFRRAAARLHFSQPAVTQQVRDLERSLGVCLFERLPGHVRLTTAGVHFVEVAQRLIEESDAAVASARSADLCGSLRIGIYPGGAAELTRPLLVELKRCLRRIQVDVVTLPITQWASSIEGVDALIMRDPVDPGCVRATELFAEPLLVAVPWSWPARESTALSVTEFLSLPLVRISSDVPAALRQFWCLDSDRFAGAEFRGYGASCPEDVAEDVASGFGAALGSPSLRRTFPAARVAFVPLACHLVTRTWLTTRLEDRREVIEALHAHVDSIARRLRPLVLPESSPESTSW